MRHRKKEVDNERATDDCNDADVNPKNRRWVCAIRGLFLMIFIMMIRIQSEGWSRSELFNFAITWVVRRSRVLK